MTIHKLIWEGFTKFFPASVAACLGLSAASVMTTTNSSPGGTWWQTYGLAVLFPLTNTSLVYSSVRHGVWRVWPLGIATVAGIAAGIWFLWFSWHKAQTPGPFSPPPLVITSAALLVGGWSAVAVFRRWVHVPMDERRRRAGQCVNCGYSLIELPRGSACPECGGAG